MKKGNTGCQTPGTKPELDMNLPAACKMEHDAIGHYARPDVLELKVNEK